MRFRKLRIAFSATCGIACVLLCALWVRSYLWCDAATISAKYEVCLVRGNFTVLISKPDYPFLEPGYSKIALENAGSPPYGQVTWNLFVIYGSDWWGQRSYVTCKIPAFFTVSALAMVVPWLRWRFSLRTLLIAMTIIAMVLGLIVFLNKKPATPPIDVGDFPREF